MKMKTETNVPMLHRGAQTLTDDLDDAVLAYVSRAGEASVRRIATEIERPYSTVMVRCLKLEVAGFLHSMWYNNVRRFHVVNTRASENVRRN